MGFSPFLSCSLLVYSKQYTFIWTGIFCKEPLTFPKRFLIIFGKAAVLTSFYPSLEGLALRGETKARNIKESNVI